MAVAGLTGRLGRLEARVDEAALSFMAQRTAAETGEPFSTCYTELRGLFRALGRLGPNPDRRAMAGVISKRYGGDEEQVYNQLVAAQKGRAG